MDIKQIAKQLIPSLPAVSSFNFKGWSGAKSHEQRLVDKLRQTNLSASDQDTADLTNAVGKLSVKGLAIVHAKLKSQHVTLKSPQNVKNAIAHVEKLLEGKAGDEDYDTGLDEAKTHYETKQLQKKVSFGAIGVTGVLTAIAFGLGGPLGIIPLLLGVLPSVTAFEKSRASDRRLSKIDDLRAKREAAKSQAEKNVKPPKSGDTPTKVEIPEDGPEAADASQQSNGEKVQDEVQ